MKTGVLLINTGTPDSPSVPDVKKYLNQFLSDPRVLDINAFARRMLLSFIILPRRSPNSASLYKKIWTREGSPLMVHGLAVKNKLQSELGNDYEVELAMRYQSPSIEKAMEKFRNPIFKKIIVLPLFPQYASASTGSAHERIMEIVKEWPAIPSIDFINSYCNNPDFIDAWVDRSRDYNLDNYDHFLFSFHGLPERQIKKADYSGDYCLKPGCCDTLNENNTFCYRAQCFETARQIASRLGIASGKYEVTFQSRLGKTPWIKPYTDDVIKKNAAEGKKRLLVFAPAFVADCLETIYEIGTEYDELFKEHGGEKVQLVESLNDSPVWINALKNMVQNQS